MGNLSSSAQEVYDDSVQIGDPPPHQVFDLISSDDDDIVRDGRRESCRAPKRVTRSCAKTQKMASISSPCTKSESGGGKRHEQASVKLGVGSEPLSNNLGGPSQRPYILPQRNSLPWQVVKKVDEKVQAIGSEIPIFVKVMTRGSVDYARSIICTMVNFKYSFYLQMQIWMSFLDLLCVICR